MPTKPPASPRTRTSSTLARLPSAPGVRVLWSLWPKAPGKHSASRRCCIRRLADPKRSSPTLSDCTRTSAVQHLCAFLFAPRQLPVLMSSVLHSPKSPMVLVRPNTAVRTGITNLTCNPTHPSASTASTETACPSSSSPSNPSSAGYECLDPRTELQSCGGCATLGEGMDCTAIPGAMGVGCQDGQCVVCE